MKHNVCFCLLLMLLKCTPAFSQTLFTYGPYSVKKKEFVNAFNKNPNVNTDRKQALKEYLDLYINFKLKVRAAYDEKLNNEPAQVAELNNFKAQIADNFINQQANVTALTEEAFEHSQKDIHLAQVFIEATGSDTAAAYQRIQAAYKELKEGKDFSAISSQFSSDAYTKNSGGDLGFITVFTLPYEFETVAYATTPGNFSSPFRSKLGYHIFKNIEERKAIGTRKVAHILIAYPPNGSITEREAAAKKADSVYALLKKGQNFEELARVVSNDISSAASGGMLAEFGIGEFDPSFEKQAYSLNKAGDVTAPFDLAGGYHILQLKQVISVVNSKDNTETLAALQDKVQRSDRLALAKKVIIEKSKKLVGFKPGLYKQPDLWKFTDSSLRGKMANQLLMNEKTVLFSFVKQKITADDWLNFVKVTRGSSADNAVKGYADLMTEYIDQSVANYYRDHLEDYNKDYQQQVKEFKDANLLFGIMDTKIWSRANNDTIGLKKFYDQHSAKYVWGPSAEALVITAPADTLFGALQQQLKTNPANWRQIIESYNGQLTADSGRYELGQLPVIDRTRFEPGLITAPVKNVTDNSITFSYIFAMHPGQQPRAFEEAKGLVISDYQQELENKWIADLKRKYPVKINRAVFEGIK